MMDDGASSRKKRLTVTIEPDLLEAGQQAVAAGRARSLSAWVSGALADRVAAERRLEVLRAAIAVYEAGSGPISPEEIAAQQRADRRDRLDDGTAYR
jgi:hypothetical protein